MCYKLELLVIASANIAYANYYCSSIIVINNYCNYTMWFCNIIRNIGFKGVLLVLRCVHAHNNEIIWWIRLITIIVGEASVYWWWRIWCWVQITNLVVIILLSCVTFEVYVPCLIDPRLVMFCLRKKYVALFPSNVHQRQTFAHGNFPAFHEISLQEDGNYEQAMCSAVLLWLVESKFCSKWEEIYSMIKVN